MAKIDRVIRALYEDKVVIYKQTSSVDCEYLRISLTEFASILRRADICTDLRAIRPKWETLIAKGILKTGNPSSEYALVDLTEMTALGFDCKRDVEFITHTHAHTHISEGSQ